jgi:hypothetical protein
MKLTETEKQAVRQGEPVEFQEDDVNCVVLRADLFEKFRGLLSTTLAPEVVTALVDETMAEFDAADPLLDTYQQYKR